MNHWHGTLAYCDRPTPGGFVLARPERLRTRPLPMPLFADNSTTPIGSILTVSIHADEIRAEGIIRDHLLTPGQPTPVGVDVLGTRGDHHPDGHFVITDWTLASANVITRADRHPAWYGAHIQLKEDTP